MIPLIDQTLSNSERMDRTAIIDARVRHRYRDLAEASSRVAVTLLGNSPDLMEARVAFLVPPGFDYVSAQWGIWRAGGLAVPLCPEHPAPELEYVLDDCSASVAIAHPDYQSVLRPLAEKRNLRFLSTTELISDARTSLPVVDAGRRALMLYTSGTTGKPKGVVTTHAIIAAQIQSLVEAWQWSGDDHILNVLPLHHIHGIINVLGCAMWSGATWESMAKFDAEAVWRHIGDRDRDRSLTLFMAVPTIYTRLIASYENAGPAEQARRREGCRGLRLMVSGSAALPISTLEKWRTISGHVLLERYGMTEIGMGISNPLYGERRPGSIGVPLPGVQARLAPDSDAVPDGNSPGEIQIKGANVFLEYWQRAEATTAAFTADHWFKTGDVAVVEDGYYRILGRESIDIIKTGGYKVSALEIEEVLRGHPAIADCAVVGVPDEEWGQRVAAAVVLKAEHELDLPALRTWSKQALAPYKVPSLLRTTEALPRNAMGKVTKPVLVQWMVEQQDLPRASS